MPEGLIPNDPSLNIFCFNKVSKARNIRLSKFYQFLDMSLGLNMGIHRQPAGMQGSDCTWNFSVACFAFFVLFCREVNFPHATL